ncbi:MAG: fatty acid desaturase [Betaproteobacteria bacterium]
MTPAPKPQREYVAEIRPLLPASTFIPRPQKLWWMLAHSMILVAGVFIIRTTPYAWSVPLVSLIMAHSIGCFGCIIHDVSHNSVVTWRPLKYLLELYVWSLVLGSAYLWHRVHNQAHHRMPNSLRDPHRRYTKGEANWAVRLFDRVFMRSRTTPWVNLTFLAFFADIVRNLIAPLLYGGSRKPAITTYKPHYTGKERLRIQAEFALAVAVHIGIFYAAGATWAHYLWAGLLPAIGGSAVMTAYAVLNHLPAPLMREPVDPLVTTISLRVPRVFDWLHQHISHHTEHHLFPNMSSTHYPLVRAILQERYPDRFQCITYREAVRRLRECQPFPEVLPAAQVSGTAGATMQSGA